VNLFKALSVALHANPGRRLIVSEKEGFPTDFYVAQGLVAQLGRDFELLLVDGSDEALEAILAERGPEIAVVLLTHIHYCTSRMYDMRRVTSAAHKAGALVVWDLSHSAGVVPVDLNGCEADFAVGCGYKHLNGGPGAPAFIYVARRLHGRFRQPISGWMRGRSTFAGHTSLHPESRST
jgi:kynureninase